MSTRSITDKLAMAASQQKKEKDYWLQHLSGEWSKSRIPYDFTPVNLTAGQMKEISYSFSSELSAELMKLSSGKDVKLNMILAAILVILLYKYTDSEDIVLGTPIYRQDIGIEFINTALVLRCHLEPAQNFKQALLHVREIILKALEHQNYPLEAICERLELPISEGDFPLFDCIFLLVNIHDKSYIHHIDCNLVFNFRRSLEQVDCLLEYNASLYREDTINRVMDHFFHITQQVLCNLDITLEQIEMITPWERQQILETFNSEHALPPQDTTIHRLFESQVQKTPDCIALVQKDKGFLTYRELNSQANRMARFLRKYNFSGETIVALLVQPTLEMIIAIFGILKIGAAYLPIEPSLPEERIKYMIDDATVNTVISEKQYIRLLNRLQWDCRNFECYFCLDSSNVLEEDERENNELMNEELWHHVGETAEDDITGGGWVSSYTGESMSRQEMDEYGDNILKKLQPLLHPHMKVLEIGCASGISMYRIAPKVESYCATDLSSIIIQWNQKKVTAEGHSNIKLYTMAAHEIDQLDQAGFDLVIINSVIQCFHGHNYLRKVISRCINKMNNKGYLFIGDVMDQDKKDNLVRDMVTYKYTHRQENITTKTDFTSELFVPRGFWTDLGVEWPEITDLQFSEKIHTLENELTRFRYDTLISIDKKQGNDNRDENVSNVRARQKQKFQEDLRWLPKAGENALPVTVMPENLAKGIIKVREGRVKLIPGFDGQYGRTEIFSPQEQYTTQKLF